MIICQGPLGNKGMNVRWNMGTWEKLAIRKKCSTMRIVKPCTGALEGCEVSNLRDVQNLTGNDPEQPYLIGAGGWMR